MKLNSLFAFGLGAGVMYLMDPDRGRRRRALVRDKFVSVTSHVDDVAYKIGRDLAHRGTGLVAELRALGRREPVPDEVIQARVRSRLGRLVSHPHALVVHVQQGKVTLGGPILAHEVNDLLRRVTRVPGVKSVENRLDIHKQAGDLPALQGGGVRMPERFELAQENWSPAARFVADLLGASMVKRGLGRGGLLGLLATLSGGALILRGTTNLQTKRLTGIGAGRRAIDIRKTLNIDAPLEDVFALWSRYVEFPRFMERVRQIKDLGNGRSHWVVSGPAGVSVEWDAVVTEFVPNELIAWKTEEGSAIEHAGLVRFEPQPDGSTRLDIRMSYNPVAGALGHLVALLSGSDPKHAMDAELIRFKSLLEHGKASAAGKHVTREEVEI